MEQLALPPIMPPCLVCQMVLDVEQVTLPGGLCDECSDLKEIADLLRELPRASILRAFIKRSLRKIVRYIAVWMAQQ